MPTNFDTKAQASPKGVPTELPHLNEAANKSGFGTFDARNASNPSELSINRANEESQ